MIKIPNKKGNPLKHIVLLRGVTPNGKNAIPKMSYLVDVLTEAGFNKFELIFKVEILFLKVTCPQKKYENRFTL